MKQKDFQELTFTDDFMFAKVMLNEKLCKQLLEIVLGIKIKNINYPELQKSMNPDYDAKSVRLDVYVDDEDGTVYNIEMQTTNPGNIPKRTRYYHGMIDLHLIEKGEDYSKLAKSYVIFICTEDISGLNKPAYLYEMYCKEHDTFLGDETYTVILNAACTELQDTELDNFLRFVKTGEATNQFTNELLNEVDNVKHTKRWEVEYMTLLMRDKEKKKEGRKEYQKLLSVIPRDSEDFSIALSGDDDVIETLYEKYDISSIE